VIFASSFTWFHLIPGVEEEALLHALGIEAHGTYVLRSAWLVCGMVLLFAWRARAGLERARARQGMEAYMADSTINARTLAEVYGEAIRGLLTEVFPDRRDLKLFFPFIASLFLYIWICNLLSVIPGMAPPTDDINANVGMAIIVFLLFNYVGFTRDAVSYLKHMWGPMLATGFLLFPIEVISLFIRPLSLTLRLTGNMFGDHTVFSVMSNLLPSIAEGSNGVVQAIAWLLPVPLPFLALALLVSTIQALVFSLLSAIYVGSSIPHGDHDDHDGDH
jgi:F-type H+-transporting ATPase subunit a